MKKNLLFAFIAVSFFCLQSFTKYSPLDEIIGAIQKSNTEILSHYFDNTVEIALPDRNDSYNKTQAEVVIKDFFATNVVKNFSADHKGNNNGSEYCIGTLVTQKGSFRLTVFMKQKSGKSLLQEIRIEHKR
jgi:Domain of unknown function (DUF4783)